MALAHCLRSCRLLTSAFEGGYVGLICMPPFNPSSVWFPASKMQIITAIQSTFDCHRSPRNGARCRVVLPIGALFLGKRKEVGRREEGTKRFQNARASLKWRKENWITWTSGREDFFIDKGNLVEVQPFGKTG
ncbi:uncharacterized protein LOC128873038 [Hylaeus volcanicus]|uniref:uncharacterized protein LOC128873038 n=1 Tax=Hylaeus volcanicus TaxID=313075 RepID=UPI0023B7F7F5|nr:uncharacterized protein LOC128873038 [Hylaeus volcanicus]